MENRFKVITDHIHEVGFGNCKVVKAVEEMVDECNSESSIMRVKETGFDNTHVR